MPHEDDRLAMLTLCPYSIGRTRGKSYASHGLEVNPNQLRGVIIFWPQVRFKFKRTLVLCLRWALSLRKVWQSSACSLGHGGGGLCELCRVNWNGHAPLA